MRTKGVKIVSATETFDENPAGRLLERMLSSVSHFDNDVRTERSVNGMKQAVREGRYVWGASFGYDNVKVGGKATIAPNSCAHIVKEIFSEIASNKMSVDQVRIEIKKRYGGRLIRSQLSKTHFCALSKMKSIQVGL